jgi:hypothetical protein
MQTTGDCEHIQTHYLVRYILIKYIYSLKLQHMWHCFILTRFKCNIYKNVQGTSSRATIK